MLVVWTLRKKVRLVPPLQCVANGEMTKSKESRPEGPCIIELSPDSRSVIVTVVVVIVIVTVVVVIVIVIVAVAVVAVAGEENEAETDCCVC